MRSIRLFIKAMLKLSPYSFWCLFLFLLILANTVFPIYEALSCINKPQDYVSQTLFPAVFYFFVPGAILNLILFKFFFGFWGIGGACVIPYFKKLCRS